MPTTVRPAFAASVARCSPPGPRPMTTRSTRDVAAHGPIPARRGAAWHPRGPRHPGGLGAAARRPTLGGCPDTPSSAPRAAPRAGQQADPVRRRRAELDGQGLGRRRRRDRALGADVPRRLRGGRAQPGRHDPLRSAQRAARRPRRAHVCRVARPRGPHARARGAAVHRRRAPPGRRLRPVRPVLLDRARLHQHAHRARPGRHPAARRRPRRQPPDRRRRRARRVQPRDDRRLRRRRRGRRRRGGRAGHHRHRRAPGSARAAPVAGARCCCAWRAPAGSTCRRSTTSRTCPTAASSASPPTPTPRRAVAGRQAHRHGPRRVALPEAAARAARRVGARADVGRDLPRLHPRLPVLPGRHDHPPGARAQHHRHRRDGRARPRRNGLRGGRAALAELGRPLRDRRRRQGPRRPLRGHQHRACRCRRRASTRSTSTSPTS